MYQSPKELFPSGINYMEPSDVNAVDFIIEFTMQIFRLLYRYKACYFEIDRHNSR